MSLLERLARDKELREDLLSLLKELGAMEPEEPPLASLPPSTSAKKKHKADQYGGDTDMKELPI